MARTGSNRASLLSSMLLSCCLPLLLTQMMKQCANSAVRFSAYQGLKDLVLSARSTTQLDSLSTMAIGSTAGIITVCKLFRGSFLSTASSPRLASLRHQLHHDVFSLAEGAEKLIFTD